ncbi:hypothetical protein [Aeromonas caviae]|uniref:hypothetical protein n=1 Tax=Aeromonas caviae TaxID=648 RepID=UPI001D0BB0EB|nr:hypothetical protein [Aeromonas caviae]UDN28500.1 hypothetical protein LEO80_08140 [Aeromonas caviae]
MKTKIHLYIPTKTAGYLSCRFCFTISQPDQPDNNAVIGNAGVLGPPHFSGTAVADSMAAGTAMGNSDVINPSSSVCAKK